MNFGKRDIALFIPDEVGDVVALRHTKDSTADDKFEALKPKLDPSKKVTRYWAGKAPKWAEDQDEQDRDLKDLIEENKQKGEEQEEVKLAPSSKPDPRLARLQRAGGAKVDRKEARERHRQLHEAEVVEAAASESEESEDEEPFQPIPGDVLYGDVAEEEEEDEEEITLRRERIRERLRMKQKEREEEELLAKEKEEDEESDSDEDSSEWETDTDESEDEEGQILKPIFVPKNQRETIKEAEQKALAEEAKKKKLILKKEDEKRRTRDMIAQIIRKESEQVSKHLDGNDSENDMPDDRDELDEALEYEAWKVRELQRIKRDKDDRQQMEDEKKETERRRNMTDEERRLEDRAIGKNKEKLKAKWKYLQKYYHKGVFYMDENSMEQDDVRARTYDGPTLEDKFDKQALPSVMQVKKFGRSGQTKYTHLVDQDTTTWDNPWTQVSARNEKYYEKVSGVGDIDNAGRKRKKPT
mmetsp:Transcript_4121/g.5295  ORF Transcript_4121/g.5295 Transcript_4121/m.5295 type:complete len:470 (+) Transcript_4121:39-1448(+)